MTVVEFFKLFPDDDTCLEHLMSVRYGLELDCPKCSKKGRFHRLKKQPVYVCQWCGFHIHPMAGTPFENTRTPLQKWFYAMYLFTTSRHGVPAKELQRQLSVTYKCAWRMGHEIRKYMAAVDGDDGLSGDVEMDETLVGGHRPGKRGRGASGKSLVFGMVERGGDVMTMVVSDARKVTLDPIINASVAKGSQIYTDEFASYKHLGKIGYKHDVVHHRDKQYVNGKAHTNSIEGFWGRLKNSIRGTHVHVSGKHLPKYLGEFEFRYNMRANPTLMFDRLLASF
jgi:transposase-like protein